MPVDRLEAKCAYCDSINQISGGELHAAISSAPSGAQIAFNCIQCARVSIILIGHLPNTGNLTTSKWIAQAIDDLGDNWLPCCEWNGREAKLPLGEYIEPGDKLSPRLWKYKNANLDPAPDGTVWWDWEAYAVNYGFDPYRKLELMRGNGWKGAIFGNEEPHHRTRIFIIPSRF